MMLPVRRVKCRCRLRQFPRPRNASVLMDRALQRCESLLTRTKTNRTRGAMHLPANSLFVEKNAGLESSWAYVIVMQDSMVWQYST